jgi:hypothetical protein
MDEPDLPDDLRTAVELWILERRAFGERLAVAEAVQRLAAEALMGMGLLTPRSRSKTGAN